MSGYQLTPPTLGNTGYQPPKNLLGDFTFKLDMSGLHAHAAWVGLPDIGMPVPMRVRLGALDQALRPTLGNLSQFAAGNPNLTPKTLLDKLLELLDDDARKAIADALNDKFATPLNVPGRTNVASGEPASIGKLNADGTPNYDGVDALVPGSDILGLFKKYKYNQIGDVTFGLMFDKDALLGGKYGYMFSGATVEVPLNIPGLTDTKLKFLGGRDQTGHATGGFTLGASF